MLLKVVEEDLALAAAVRKTGIVLKPVNLHDLATVTSALKISWAFSSVKVVNPG